MFTSTGYEFMHEVTMIDKTRGRQTSRCGKFIRDAVERAISATEITLGRPPYKIAVWEVT